ncbi:hypothetical protein PybrP1_004001 [[Pythium] brassicae (nom. inval.)]|nr:hypothetical protein PybrP1_004001 [[Pythium] brassicae (nom. inval.)]
MASVRSAPRREDAAAGGERSNKKRKRSGGAKSRARSPTLSTAPGAASPATSEPSSAVDVDARRQLASLAKWQLCTQQMRRELEKVEQAADTAVGQVQDEAADFRAARAQAEAQAAATTAYVAAVQRDVETAVAAAQSELQGAKKKLRALEQSAQQLRAQSIDEDALMTQLAALQERSEAELSKRADDTAAQLAGKQQALDALQRQLKQATAAARQEREDAARAQAALAAQVQALAARVQQLEAHERQPTATATAAEVAELARRLERQQEDAERRLKRKLSELAQQQLRHHASPPPPQQQQPQVSPFSSPPPLSQQQQSARHAPPPPFPHHHPYAEEHSATSDALRRLGRDVRLIGEDLHRLTQRMEAQHGELHEALAKKLGALAAEVFGALECDARRHATEHKRLHDMADAALRDGRDLRESVDRRVRDIVNYSVLDVRDGMKRLDDTMRRVLATARPPPRSRSRSPRSPRRYPNEMYAGRTRSFDARRDAGAFHSEHAVGGEVPSRTLLVPSYVGPAIPRRSRSRSPQSNTRPRDERRPAANRSPPRSAHRPEASTATALNAPAVVALTHSRGSSPEPDRQRPTPPCVVDSSQPDVDLSQSDVDPEPSSSQAGDERHEAARDAHHQPAPAAAVAATQPPPPPPPPPPAPRAKRPRVSYEVIVIEDDEPVDDAVVSPNRAPPDVVTEDDDARPPTIVIYESADSASDEDESGALLLLSPPSPDRLRTLSDLRLGALLYFCYGGAPDLDVHWTRFFSPLGAADCIELSRATAFLRQYPELHAFPIYLAQFTVQAIMVEAPGSGAQGLGLADDAQAVAGAVSAQLVATEFHKVLGTIRHTWAELLTAKLRKLGELHSQTAGSVELAVNPALLTASSTDVVVVVGGVAGGAGDRMHRAWAYCQAESLWLLLRQHRFGANLPAFSGDLVASPGVYVFLLMFDPVHVSRRSPQRASFRLTNWGRVLVIQLWDRVLSKLPYLLFADCSWLEKQTDTSGTLPPLGFCYMLSAVLAWNSLADRELASSAGLYRKAVLLILDCLRVGGASVTAQAGGVNLTLDKATEIELVGVSELVGTLQLDGFFETAHAILVHMAAAATAKKAALATGPAPPGTPVVSSSTVAD